MLVWLWDATGSGTVRGVTGDQDQARQRAEACLRSGQASRALVEQAFLVIGCAGLGSRYERTGEGWTAQHSAEGITWAKLRVA